MKEYNGKKSRAILSRSLGVNTGSTAKENIQSLDQAASVFNNGREKRIVLFSVGRMAVACVPQRGLAFQKGFYKGEEM